MLKKAAITVAVATAGLLAAGPLASADSDVQQERRQYDAEGNGIDHGNQLPLTRQLDQLSLIEH